MLSLCLFTGCGRADSDNGNANDNAGQIGTENTENGVQNTPQNNDGSSDMTDQNSSDIQNQGSDLYQGYQSLVQGGNDKEELYQYLEENGAGVMTDEADEMVASLFSYYDNPEEIDSERIMQIENLNLSDGMRSFLTAMKREFLDPTIDENGIKVSQEELLNRSLEMENIYLGNRESPVAQLAYNRYNTLIHAAVTGGYDSGNNMPNSYANEDGTGLSDDAITGYQNFIENNPDSKTAGLLQNYLGVFEEGGKTIGDGVIDFYDSIKDTVRDLFDGI